MTLYSVNGIPHIVALVIVLAVAAVLRLAWRRLFVHKWVAEYTVTPVFLLILAVGSQVIFGRLAGLPEVRRLAMTPYISGAIYIFMVVSVTWVAYGLVKGITAWYLGRLAPKTGTTIDNELIPAFGLILKVLLIFVAAMIVLDHYNVKLSALLGAAGVVSLALALAAQETLGNMFAGFSILVDRPFRLGDRVELPGGRVGDVQEIGLRSTKILSSDHTVYIIPNSEIAKSSITNYSYPTDRLKVRQKVSVPYGSDIENVKRILMECCRAHPLVLTDPPPLAMLSQLGDSSLQVAFSFWVEDLRSQGRALDEINTTVYARLERDGIRIAPPREELLVSKNSRDPERIHPAASDGPLERAR